MSNIVEIRDLVFGYGDREILSGINMTFPRGKVIAIMGGSGSGKTTILRLIGGQLLARAGQVMVDGEEVNGLDTAELYKLRRKMGMLFQYGALFTDLSVFENVAFPLREQTDLPEELIRDLVLMKLNAVGLRNAAQLEPGEISGGMARRVALARAIALDPQLILYDEPVCRSGPYLDGCHGKPDPQVKRRTSFDVRSGVTRCHGIILHCRLRLFHLFRKNRGRRHTG